MHANILYTDYFCFMRLNDVAEGKTVFIKYIAGESREIERLSALGVSCGSKLVVLYSQKKGGCVVVADGEPVGLSAGLCRRVEVD